MNGPAYQRWTVTLPDGAGFDVAIRNTYEAEQGMYRLLGLAGCEGYAAHADEAFPEVSPAPAGEQLLEDPTEHEVDCECSGCTDQWRPEDAGPGILEAERYAAAQQLTQEEIFDFLAGPADPQRAAAAGDPRGEADR